MAKSGMNIRIKAKLTEGFSNIIKEYSTNYATGKRRLGEDVRDRARQMAPIETGALRESISVITKEYSDFNDNVAIAKQLRPEAAGRIYSAPSTTVHDVIITAPMHYAPFQEFGTRYHGAQPYLIPAFEEVISKFEQYFNAIMKVPGYTTHRWG
jgi:HK97 gp10 family phage protein